MTVLQALQAEVQYSNTNILEKILLDLSLEPTDTYTADMAADVEIATAHLLRRAARMPEFSEGSLRIKWDAAQCNAEADRLFAKNGITDQYSGPVIDGTPKW